MPKTSSIHSSVSIEHRLVTDTDTWRQTQGHVLVPALTVFIVKFPVIVVVVYVATSLLNKGDYILCLYKVPFVYDRLGPCFRFVHICIYLYLYCCVFVLLPFLRE